MLELTNIEKEELSSLPKECLQSSQEEIHTILVDLVKE